jgi:hypothetical protein
MDTNAIFQNGSIGLRADFHLHTKADKGFIYYSAENDFVNGYVAKLVEQKIQVGVITNHTLDNLWILWILWICLNRRKRRKYEY